MGIKEFIANNATALAERINKALEKNEQEEPKCFQILMESKPGKRRFSLEGKILYTSNVSLIGKETFFNWNNSQIGIVSCHRASLFAVYKAAITLNDREGGTVNPINNSAYKYRYKNCIVTVSKLDGSITIKCDDIIYASAGSGIDGKRLIQIYDPEYGDEMIMVIAGVINCMNLYARGRRRSHLIPM